MTNYSSVPDNGTNAVSTSAQSAGTAAPEAEALHALVLQSLDDDQAQDVVSIPLEGKSNIADFMVIASGRSTRQVASMAQKMAERIKKDGGFARIEGLTNADWVLLDAGDVVVHLFRPEVRTFYNLERMWAFGDTPEGGSDSGSDSQSDTPSGDKTAPQDQGV